MEKRTGYQTKQRETILMYLKNNKDKHISVDEILYHLRKNQTPVGKSTVYRYLDKLVKQNRVRKYQMEEGISACYQYLEDDNCIEHYHFRCSECGNLFHVSCDLFQHIEEHLKKEHHFYLDNSKTILYGLCEKCKALKQKGNEDV